MGRHVPCDCPFLPRDLVAPARGRITEQAPLRHSGDWAIRSAVAIALRENLATPSGGDLRNIEL